MEIKRTNPFTGEINSLDLDVTIEQIEDYHTGTLAQYAFSNLNADEREFLISGILPGEFEEIFK